MANIIVYSHSHAIHTFFMGAKCENLPTETECRQRIIWRRKKKNWSKNCGNTLKRQYFDKCPSAEEFMTLSAKWDNHCKTIFMQNHFFATHFAFIVVNELLILWIFDAAKDRRFIFSGKNDYSKPKYQTE